MRFSLLFVILIFLIQASKSLANYPDFTKLVENNQDQVVNITSTASLKSGKTMPWQQQFPGIPEEFLRKFFGIDPDELQKKSKPDKPKEIPIASGSGFIISEDGYILTNHHVIDSADKIVVKMRNRSEMIATLVGFDKLTDIALLKIDTKDKLNAVKFGNSSKLKVGEWVVAMGSPFGFDHTVTAGIVSAKQRALPGDRYVPFIQSDTAVNPGNSGGPLFNMDGEVVGINSQIYSSSGGFIGLSFAIPSELAQNIANQLKSTGKILRGYLGVQIQEVTVELSETFGTDLPSGALVAKIYDDSPAEKYGIQLGDVILEIDGKKIKSADHLPPIVGQYMPGTKVKLKVLRRNKTKYLNVTIGTLPSDEGEARGNFGYNNDFGAQLANLTDEEKKELEVEGVKVIDIKGGIASNINLKIGDIIEQLNFQPVTSVKKFNEVFKSLEKGKRIAMRIIRGNVAMFVSFTVNN